MSQSSSHRLHFLGWDRPLILSATDHLWEMYGPQGRYATPSSGQEGVWDLSELLIILPTGRGVRRMSQRVKREAGRRRVELKHPHWITVGELPSRLYRRGGKAMPLADETEATLAWTAALRTADDSVLAPLFATIASRDSFDPWFDLAVTLRRLHEDLAANHLSFADVVRDIRNDPASEGELDRWLALSSLYAAYLKRLAAAGRTDPAEEIREAILAGSCRVNSPILLVGTSDLSVSLTAMLLQAAANANDRSDAAAEFEANRDGKRTGPLITTLIAADPDHHEMFDRFGTVVPARWSEWKLPLEDTQLVAADDVGDQAAAAIESVAAFRQRHAVGEITIGVTDESMVAPVEFELRQVGLHGHRELGWTFSLTPAGRLAELLETHITQRSWQSLAALVRHADVHDWLERKLDPAHAQWRWLDSLDELMADHYPTDLDGPLTETMLLSNTGKIGATPAVAVRDLIDDLLGDFRHRDQRKRLRDWAAVVESIYQRVYESTEPVGTEPNVALGTEQTMAVTLGTEQTTAIRDASAGPNPSDQPSKTDRAARRGVEAVRIARRELQRLSQLGETLDAPVSPATAIELITAKLLEKRIADEPLDDAIQISGWLDLAMDESLAMVVVGFNHPFVPDSVTADPFLPGSLRGRLRMNDNERRLARDTYAAQLILATRPQTRLIVGRRAADGSPTPPSRLLAASTPEDLSRRLIALLDPQATNRRRCEATPIPRAWEHPLTKTRLPVPSLPPLAEPITSMSVTSFSAYLACPYRFYLRHVLKLDPFDDAQRELAANQFGDMIHQSLEWFGHSSSKDETRVGKIEDELIDALDRYAKQHFGPSPSPAVRLQVEQARRRLRHVARVQAERRQQGWQIVKVEDSVGAHNNAAIEVDGRKMTIRGRFDRVDRHEQTGDWAILDYKSHGHMPRKKHLQKVGRDQYRWIDLQLPIYRLMIPFLVGESVDPDRVRLGYFNIGDKETDTRINEADFKPEEFRQAEEVIKDCIRGIWQGDFRPSPDPVLYDDYAMILQSDTAAPWLELEETAAEG